MPTPSVFISYSHVDEEWRQRLVLQLRVLELQGTFRAWDDRQIPTGEDWRPEIEQQMAAADAAVLLVSADFLISKFILENEVPVLLERRKRDGLRVFPLIVRPTNPGEVDWLAPIQWQPRDGRDLLSMLEASVASAERLLADFAKEVKDSLGAGAARSGRRPASTAAPAAPVVTTARLPVTGETFVAREEELATLDAAWEEGMNVVSFVAMGGAGKSALVNAWLGRMQVDGWRGAERVLGWSFYSQGTEGTSASSDNFTAYALEWLGYDGEPITSPWQKGETIARLVRQRRTLLLLDGLEPLQHPPGVQTGRIKDPAVQALVRELAADNPGLCVVTSRLPVADVAGRAGTVAVDLEALSPEAGAELLRRLGVEGSGEELRAAAEELGGHGLALTLLGTYLRDVLDGDVRRRGEVRVLDEEIEIEGSAHARRMLEGYAALFGDGPEVRVLHLLGLFDRPAETAALVALRAAPEIPGLSEGVGEGNETAWKLAVARLRKARLVASGEGGGGLDAHPLVREYFGSRLAQRLPEAWREGNLRLYEHYRQVPEKDLPDTLEELLPLYAAVVHGCRAGRVQEAFEEVYQARIRRGNEFYSIHKLGAFGAELTVLAAFFERPWARPSAQLGEGVRAWLLNTAGFVLRALGRPADAVAPMQAGLEARVKERGWRQAAISASNLSELTLTLGAVANAVAAGEEGVGLGDKSGDTFQRMVSRTTLADALHQAGRREESATVFHAAETMQAELALPHPQLFSLRGYQYCDLLLGGAEPEDGTGLDGTAGADAGRKRREVERYRQGCEEVRGRANFALEIAQRNRWLLDVALGHLFLGRAHLGLALTAPAGDADREIAAGHLDLAVGGLRQAGHEDELPRGLLARAALRRLTGDPAGAAADLNEAEEIANRGSMKLYLADVHLERTRLSLFQKDDPTAARESYEEARRLVAETGYGRREREVRFLGDRLGLTQR
jgi:hypothetical protein